MTQSFETFVGLPTDLVIRLNTLKALGETIVQVVTCSVNSNYVIIYQS
jgi:hypothetical protein